jgi:hypothetical protein
MKIVSIWGCLTQYPFPLGQPRCPNSQDQAKHALRCTHDGLPAAPSQNHSLFAMSQDTIDLMQFH